MVIQSHRNLLMMQGERTNDGFKSAGGTQQVTGNWLCRTDRKATGVRAKNVFDRLCLDRVVGIGRGAVCVDVIDRIGADPRLTKRFFHRQA